MGETSVTGTDAGFIEACQSPFYFRSNINVGAEIVYFKESKGGGCYSHSHFDFLLKIGSKWYLAAKSIINQSEGEPFFAGLIPHKISVYRQEGGDRGHFRALECEPLPVDHRQKRLCPACNRHRQEVREQRARARALALAEENICSAIAEQTEEVIE